MASLPLSSNVVTAASRVNGIHATTPNNAANGDTITSPMNNNNNGNRVPLLSSSSSQWVDRWSDARVPLSSHAAASSSALLLSRASSPPSAPVFQSSYRSATIAELPMTIPLSPNRDTFHHNGDMANVMILNPNLQYIHVHTIV